MRIKMLKDVPTVGEFLNKGGVYEIQDLLATALIERGQAEDIFKAPAPPKPKVEEPKVKTTEVASVEEVKPSEETAEIKPEVKVEEKPAKKAAKKPAKKG